MIKGGKKIYGLQVVIGTLRAPLSEQRKGEDLLSFFLIDYETELVMLTHSLSLFLVVFAYFVMLSHRL